MIKRFTYTLLFLVFIISCNKEEDNPQAQNEARIKAFKIINNSINGIDTSTELDLSSFNGDNIEAYGVKWYKKTGDVNEERFDNLSNDFFDISITEKILKDSLYKTYSYIEYEGKIVNSDTLEFKSNFTTPIIIDSIYPKNGFLYDTLSIKGKNFCTQDFRNLVYMNNRGYTPIFESDSLMKVIIPTGLRYSELYLSLKTCGVNKDIQDKFTIDPPKLDSIESGDKFVGDKVKIYGKNLHYSISELWLDNVKTTLDYTEYKDTLIATIPRGLSKGKVDVKLKVLDKVIELPNYYQTTTPYITEVEPLPLGFFDVVRIKGGYFKQGSGVLPKITIADREQSLVSFEKDFIDVIVDRYFYFENPELKIQISDFTDAIPVNVRAPKLLDFDKEIYNLTDDLSVNTDAFIEKNNLKIGGRSINYRGQFEIDNTGKVKVSLKDWLNIDFYSHNYELKEGGKLQVDLKNNYGTDSKDIQIYAPIITSLNKEVYVPGDRITLQGNNFAYSRYNKVYIDGDLVNNPNSSSYTVNNNEISFPLLKNTLPGKHSIYVEVAGQKSNVLEYEVKEVKVNSISRTEGTRRDAFIVKGEDLQSLIVSANGESCEIIRRTDNEVEFKLTYYIKLVSSINIVGMSGDQRIEIASINGIEPHDIVNESLSDVNYYGDHVAGSDSKNWYYMNNRGVFKFNLTLNKWEVFDSNPIPFSTFIFGTKRYLTVTDSELKIAIGNKLYSYDLVSKVWTTKDININVKNGVIINNMLYAINNDDREFYEYNLTDNTSVLIYKPSNFNFNLEVLTYGADKIFFNPYQGESFYYNINNKSFTGMGRPRNFFGTYQNVALKYYNSKLYYIGGLTDAGKEHRIYEFDLNSRTWNEKTPMLIKGYSFSTHIKDGVFYIGLGYDRYGYTNDYMNIYDLNKDPY